MITPFTLARTPVIHFGAGKISQLTKIIRSFGDRALILTGASSFTSGQQWPSLQQGLADAGIWWAHGIIDKEPAPSMIDTCVMDYRNENIQAVIAIGGGSVMDAGKAISALLPVGDSVKFYLEGIGTKTHPGSKVPFIAVPTTSGTGSETTKNAVISEVGEHGFKKSLRHDNFVPDIALVDPELTLHCPRSITASSGMDAFTQLLESYLSTASNPLTDSLAIEGLRRIHRSLIPAWAHGSSDIEARTDMAYASLISGITLANAGLGTVHGFASSLGGYFDIPHGVICSRLMAPANKLTAGKLLKADKTNKALDKYAEVGRIFSGKENQTRDYYIQFLLEEIETWTKQMAIPGLSSFGVSKTDFERILQATDNKNNPVKLNAEELHEVLELAL